MDIPFIAYVGAFLSDFLDLRKPSGFFETLVEQHSFWSLDTSRNGVISLREPARAVLRSAQPTIVSETPVFGPWC